MIHCREHLINWLINNSTEDVLLQNAFRHPGTWVELLGLFDPLPGSLHPGWLVRVITYRKREDLIAVVQDHLDRPCRWYVTDHVSWNTWQGPDEDILIGGDKGCGPIMKTKVVHCKYDEYDVLIDRTTKYGNPYIIGPDGNRDEVCDKHENWLRLWIEHKQEVIVRGRSNKWVVEHLSELEGKRIACHCAPARCHGDTCVRILHGKEKEAAGRFDRIKRCAPVYIKPNRIKGERKAGPPVVKKRPVAKNLPTRPPQVKQKIHNNKTGR